ncbi:MAG: hypothetical protein ACR2NB_10580, partial [Solirubrobacteraceae bacterium]
RTPLRGTATLMGYVIVAIIVLLVVAGGVTFLVMRATSSGSSGSTPASPEPGDPTAAGDTQQLADEDASGRGGAGGPISGPHPGGREPAQDPDEPAGARYKRDSIGGEGEGESTIDAGEAPQPGR